MSRTPFSSIVAEHGATVAAVCRSILPIADADDAWSETFLAALRSYPDLDENANIAAWLTVIARNKSIDIHRARARRAIPVEDIATVNDQRPATMDDQRLVADGDTLAVGDELRAALESLTERQRTAVLAHHVAGLPYAEIAELLGSSEAAARRSAADGIAKLRRHHRRGPSR